LIPGIHLAGAHRIPLSGLPGINWGQAERAKGQAWA